MEHTNIDIITNGLETVLTDPDDAVLETFHVLDHPRYPR